MKQVQLVKHPLIDHSLTILRDKTTKTDLFRQHAAIVSEIVLLEAFRKLTTKTKKIYTPLSPFDGKEMKDDVVVVPVLRAGLAMLFAIQDILPTISVGFVGLERNEQTAIAREYYRKLPKLYSKSRVIVLDPMLATGGSFDDTLTLVKNKGAKRLTVVCIVSAPEGLERVTKQHSDVTIYTAAIDHHLNEKKYIVPGLGDFGDRYFGTV
jgi:uracil phosphoribosyltransferase